MNLNSFTLKAQQAIQASIDLAQHESHQAVEAVHIAKHCWPKNRIPYILLC